MWAGSLIAALLGNQFPGAGTTYLDQALHFLQPVHVGDTLVVSATVRCKEDAGRTVEFDCLALNQRGEPVLRGTASVQAPVRKIRRAVAHAPRIPLFDPEARFAELLAKGAGLEAVRCAVVHPCDKESLAGAIDAARHGLIIPVLVGPEGRIRQIAREGGILLGDVEIIDVPHSHAAADRASELAAGGQVEALMKGSLHTDELIHAILQQPRLRTGRRMSHVFRFDVPMYHKPLLITDAALNIRPTLAEKVDIIQNAVDLARILGVELPKVAILSAVETVNPAIPSTLDAAALCKMAERGQISGAIVDGPLAFDNAISSHAAAVKHIVSRVAGDADILAVPDLESGNMLAKQLEYLAGASGSGLVLGAAVPIALTSRADGPMNRAASALLAKLAAHSARRDRARRAAAGNS
jgi:phosphate acetyltransferase